MATYYALTTENAQALGWHIVAIAGKQEEAEAARDQVELNETERRNFVVASETAARRRYGITDHAIERYLESQS
jgi:hypothetical protein